MKPRKTALSLLCAVALTLTLLVVPSSASGSLFFLSLNDTLPAQSTQTTPIQYNGWVYVPVNVFSSRITGINFGVYYGVTENGSSILLYNLSGRSITFDLTNGTAVTSEGETINPSRAIAQDGVCHCVPKAYHICRYFGLTYSYYSTDYGPLLRIKDGNAVLSDALFLNSAESIMRSQLRTQLRPGQHPQRRRQRRGERRCHSPRWGRHHHASHHRRQHPRGTGDPGGRRACAGVLPLPGGGGLRRGHYGHP